MITLNQKQLQELVDNPDTLEYLDVQYDWQQDMHMLYSDKLRLERGALDREVSRDGTLKNCRDKAVRQVLDYLEEWAEFYNYVECNAVSEHDLLRKLLACVYTGEDPTTGRRSTGFTRTVILRKYPQYVHEGRMLRSQNFAPAMREALRSFHWVTPGKLATFLGDAHKDWDFPELELLSRVLSDSTTATAFTSTDTETWRDCYESFMPDLIKCVRFPQWAQQVADLMQFKGCSEEEAEAIFAVDAATRLLHRFSKHIHRELSYYEQKYAGYKAYTEIASFLHEEKATLLGRLVGWEHSGLPASGSNFLLLSVWEPGKDRKSAWRYYLVKE